MANQFGKSVLVAGLLAASANAAFADNRDHAQNHQPRQSHTQPARDADSPVTAITKDGKAIQVTIEVPVINKGGYTDDQFKRSLKGGVMMAALQTFSQYTEAEIPGHIADIQKKISDAISPMVPMGTVTGGKPDYAKPGVNYGTAQVTKVAEVQGGKVLFEKPATKSAPPTTKPGGKPVNA